MDRYLENHFKGKFRILPELDLETNNFVMDSEGESYDDSFADFYIKCAYDVKVKHAVGNELSCYIPSTGRGMNVLRELFEKKLGRKSQNYTNDKIAEILIEKDILVDCDILDGEIYFIFKTSMFEEDIAPLISPRTNGASISPLSSKNLPKSTYQIPKADLEKYNDAKKGLELKHFGVMNKQFIDKFMKKNTTKDKTVKTKELIHKSGLWQEYCNFVAEYPR